MALTRITKGVIKPNENYDTHNINSTGIVTAIGLDVNGNGDISGNLSVGGVLTYEDVTSIDSVGIITAQKDIHVGSGVSVVGIVTAATFKGDGDFVNIDVDGHTNLDNVSVVGVTTITSSTFPLVVHADTSYQGILVHGNGAPTVSFAHQNTTTPDWKIGLSGSNHTALSISEGAGNANRLTLNAGGGGGVTGTFTAENLGIDGYLYHLPDTDTKLQFGTNEIFLKTGGSTRLKAENSGVIITGVTTVTSDVNIADSIVHTGDTDTKIRFPSNDQISFETAGVDRGRFDNDGNFLIGTTGHGNAGAGARHLVISGPSNQGLTINSTNTSGIYRDCNIYFGYGTSTNDMAKGQLTYSGNGDYLHMSVGNTAYTLAKSFRLNSDGTVRFDSTHTNANSQSLVIKSHKARALNDNNGIVFRDANDHTQAVINVTKMSTSDGSSDLVFRTSNGQVVNTLQGIPERMRITSDGHVLPATTNTYDLGSTSKRWRNVYTNDLNLSNEGGSNDVDGTWGSYTIQEGEDDLFLINKRSGKKYKFNLTEVS